MLALLSFFIMQERYIRWWTPHLSRDFEMLAFGGGGGLPLVIFPTSFGRYYQNKDFGLIDAVAWFVESGRVTIYCPDAIDLDSFYNKSIHPADRMRTHLAYENVIVRDVFDFARRECSTHRVAICGASLGAYHAANIAFKYPNAISQLISLSGAFEISDFFDGYHDDNIYFKARMSTSQTSLIHGNSITWESFWARENGIIPAMSPCGSPAS